MLEYAPTGFIENELAKGIVLGYPAGLFSQGFARRWGDAADNDVADFAFGMAGDYVNDLT